jgi:ferredoxin
MHWDKISNGQRGMDWSDFCDEISRLPRKQLWRHNQAGDLPGDGVLIDQPALEELVQANRGKCGFTYTHYPLVPENIRAIEAANEAGFVINVSCDSLTASDAVAKITSAPQAVVVPSTFAEHSLYTDAGRHVVVCPATYRKDMDCARCGICADRSPNRAVIAFPAHGTKKRVIDLKMIKEKQK